ncbi:hypothetical protein CFB52_027420 [Burkholderia sp. AU18528]|nr:hypothetical protein WS85_24055 [Burkholderia anthina]OXI16540.1 hypothetical protein CFB35_27455 [Burkholderia sp. AU16482]PHP85846.1 hypothetical protein CFB52_027420 [Burkholderia sp. AU18528]KVH08297.1 hypothetical protein WS84_21315 [Burkholderia anthina]KVN54550.1 hypothetical protein WT13_26350 [Burkholderia anthina]
MHEQHSRRTAKVAVESILEAERDRYLQFFRSTVSQLQTSVRNVATEVLISINNDRIPYPYRYLRVDALAKDERDQIKPYEFAIDPDPAFVAEIFRFRAFDLNLHPFTWNRLQVVFDRQPPETFALDNWITTWLDVGECGGNSVDGLAGAIHGASQVESNDHWSFFTVDFGTAPTTALMHLLDIIAKRGVKQIFLKAG